MIRFDYPRLTLVIALVLGETAERSFTRTLMISDGNAGIHDGPAGLVSS